MKRFLLLILMIFTLFSCSKSRKADVLYINSYKPGYPLSDEIMEAIKKEFSDKKASLSIFFLDSKTNPTDDSIKAKALEAFSLAKQIKPDLIILSDDNAVKYFGTVYKDSLPVPFVFCGVNWDHRVYNLPSDQFTGMLEVLPVREIISILKLNQPNAKELGILSENTNSERKNQVYLNTLTGMENVYRLADNFTEWKQMFIDLSSTCDFIFLPTNGAVKYWNDEEAVKFIREHIKVPVFTCDNFMMKYCVFGMTKVTSEQGEWAAKTAWLILDGKKVSEIQVVKNQQFETWINNDMAQIIEFQLPALDNVRKYPPR